MIYDNEKLNEIFHDTWPNLGWAIKDNKKVEKPTKTNSKNGSSTRST